MMWEEVRRVIVHMRLPLQTYVLLAFLFAFIASSAPFSHELILGFVSWFLLMTGITVFNSYYDRDVGPVVGLGKPPKTSRSMLYGAVVLKAAGLALTAMLNIFFLSAYVTGVLLSVLYSHSKFRIKSNGFAALLFNFVLGAGTFVVAASFGNAQANAMFLGSVVSGIFMASLYMMTQVYQTRDDQSRGDMSVAVLFGKKAALKAAAVMITASSAGAVYILYIAGVHAHLVTASAVYLGASVLVIALSLRYRPSFLETHVTSDKFALGFSYTANALLAFIYASSAFL